MIVYNLSSRGTMVAATPFLTLVPSANRSFLVTEIDIQGAGNASAPNEAALFKVANAGTGAGTAITYPPSSPEDPNMTGTGPALAFSGVVYSAYASTQPTLGALKINCPFNSNGQRFFWKANTNKNNAFVVPGNSTGLTFAPISGTGAYVIRLQVEEL